MRRLIRPLLLWTCTASICSGPAQAAPHRAGPVAESHQHQPRRATRGGVVERRTAAGRELSGDRACPIEQPQLRRAIRTHRVARGDSLTAIAYRYGTSVRALEAANALDRSHPVHTDQVLVIPQHLRPGGGDDWLKYAHAPKEPGRLDLYTYTTRFRGPVIADGKLLPAARAQISALLGVKGARPPLSERLLRLLVRVSDTFGGRPVRVVSGFRTSSYYSDSRHRRSEAVDFSIPGVPNAVVRQYLLLLADVGVGYYPNSSFLHLDVRSCPMQWTDYAGPGEPPRRSPRGAPRLPRRAEAEAEAEKHSEPEDVALASEPSAAAFPDASE
jgi:LysM repeat protein